MRGRHIFRNCRLVAFGLSSLIGILGCTEKDPNRNENAPLAKVITLADCKKDVKKCEAVDIDSVEAKEAYLYGCDHSEAYSCFRWGQFLEEKLKDKMAALEAYNKACLGKDSYGCDAGQELRSQLCYLENKKEVCRGEPQGEYRALLFLRDRDEKWLDCLVKHDFDVGFHMDEVEKLYRQRLKEKDSLLLKALKLAKEKGHHDGADAETLNDDIDVIEGKTEIDN